MRVQIDASSIEEPLVKPDWTLLEQLGASISRAMDMALIGIDVIIDCLTQQYAIIDINSFRSRFRNLWFQSAPQPTSICSWGPPFPFRTSGLVFFPLALVCSLLRRIWP